MPLPSGLIPQEPSTKYTVPTIHHLPSNKFVMDSALISKFLESVYPSPPIALSCPSADAVAQQSRATIGSVFRSSIAPREVLILRPQSAAYFSRGKERELKEGLEEIRSHPEKEDAAWGEIGEEVRRIAGEMERVMGGNAFLGGETPCYSDFNIAGSLQSARTVDESVFERIVQVEGFRKVYEACVPYMEKKD